MKILTNVLHVMLLVDVVPDQETTNVVVVTNQDIYKKTTVLIHVLYQVSILMMLPEPVDTVTSLVENVPAIVLVLVSSVMKVISWPKKKTLPTILVSVYHTV
jgi:hypothetical protein